MIPAEIIQQKRNGQSLSKKELRQFIQSYLDGTILDSQMSALLMAIYFQGMKDDEISSLVDTMLNSGKRMDFSSLDSYPADKHSTGGVGDKVSIILGPLLASAGLAIPMISGRSLGHTGGTLDKLETIPGFRVDVSLDEFEDLTKTVGIAMIGQTEDICPADRKMYALRDVTGTVESIPLICGSIMSKKIAEGIRGLVLDVKVGNGAFMKTLTDAKKLGEQLTRIGESFGVETDVVYTSMAQPLGNVAGLWCEIQESVDGLQGRGPADTMAVTYELGAKLLIQSGIAKTKDEAIDLQKHLITSGKAYEKFMEMVKAQGGSTHCFSNDRCHAPKYFVDVLAEKTGIIQSMDTYQIGLATVELGCGRKKTSDTVDPSSGIRFLKKIGDSVEIGEPIFRCFNSNKKKLDNGKAMLATIVNIADKQTTHKLFLK
ncbi:MAG: thymidine phosphorylase [Candidatus Marinimicrobia bacterium]|nr:thymidine phosphorylase [Candidatus Neomarinimicrobiota bacterium]